MKPFFYLTLWFLLSAFCFGCGEGDKTKESKRAPISANPSGDAKKQVNNNSSDLVGSWRTCKYSEGDKVVGGMEMEFSDAGKINAALAFFADRSCTQKLDATNDSGKSITQIVKIGSYKVGKKLEVNLVELDIVTEEGPKYFTYKIEGGQLFLANTKDQTSPQNRAKPDMSMPFTKTK